MATGFEWRQARLGDVQAIADVARNVLTDFPERDAVFAERISLAPSGCHVLEAGSEIAGYVLSHPWRRRNPPPLNHMLGALPDDADCCYLHDISIGSRARGSGAAGRILDQLFHTAHHAHMPAMALVAVAGAARYWRRHGFHEVMTDDLRQMLQGYGSDAVYMERRLAGFEDS